MEVPYAVVDLVERFHADRDKYLSASYKEDWIRRDFIDPLFEALGWDVTNKSGVPVGPNREVIPEDAIKVHRATKAPDYGFYLRGARKFFVEAKKPSVNLHEGVSPAFQLRRYAWSAKLPLSILTDFEELATYDCRYEPKKEDGAATARLDFLTYEQYLDRWEEIASIFSKEAVLSGSLERYAEETKRRRGTETVDSAFLREIEGWRSSLARDLAVRNDLNRRQLNYAVQMTIDRLVFLRMAEDRGIEDYSRLLSILEGDGVYGRLVGLFREADDRYNSGLFHFRPEREREEQPDLFTPALEVGDRLLRKIVRGLYYPESPYEFSVLPVDVLGQVYEQFLGKVIRLSKGGHNAVVEEKPEVRKAGGVYYTPTYIVDYIVEHTVGKLLEGKRPGPRGGARKLKVVDPACGSGSFLIGAYAYLLDWHRDRYVEGGPDKWPKEIYQGPGGEWRLTIDEKKRILTNNLYGVDIDPQAVEVTKLSLLLKVLEGETDETLESQLRLFAERALPDLDDNIKCGNSLIGPDFYEDEQMMLLDDEEHYRINVFDWEEAFPQVFGGENAGFDVVIGNPPYVDIKALPNSDVRYIFSNYPCANSRINLFAAFIEQSLKLVNSSSFRLSMIVPTALLTQNSYKALRRKITNSSQISNLVRLPNESFGAAAGDVKVDTVIFVIGEQTATQSDVELLGYEGYKRIFQIESSTAQVHGHVKQTTWSRSDDNIWFVNVTENDAAILEKSVQGSVPLEQCVEFSLGITPYDKYKGHSPEQIQNKVFHADFQKDETFKKLLAGNDVARYFIRWNGLQWISYGPWLGAAREQRFFTDRRIVVKQIIDWTSKRIWASITEEELYNTQNAFNLLAKPGWSLEYLLGIINSRLMTFYHRKTFLDEFKMRFQKILIKDCRRLPIQTVDFSDLKATAQHNQLSQLVEHMLMLQKQIREAKIERERIVIQHQIDATDRQMDQLVYDLYDLSDEEVAIIEEATAS